jgi:hypothetical protein
VLHVAELVGDPDLAAVDQFIGVHIRGRALEDDIAGVDRSVYGATAADVTDRWRRRTGVDTFAAKMRRLPAANRYFIAADQPAVLDALREEFGASRIFSVRRRAAGSCDARSVECAQLALADILLLARVRTMLGSGWSSFSEVAVRLNAEIKFNRVLFAGVHFGNGR